MGPDREESGQALTGVRVGQVSSLENKLNNSVPTPSGGAEGNTTTIRDATGWRWTGGVVDLVHARRLLMRESGDPLGDHERWDVARAENPKGVMQP
jgi:hypothetical protein